MARSHELFRRPRTSAFRASSGALGACAQPNRKWTLALGPGKLDAGALVQLASTYCRCPAIAQGTRTAKNPDADEQNIGRADVRRPNGADGDQEKGRGLAWVPRHHGASVVWPSGRRGRGGRGTAGRNMKRGVRKSESRPLGTAGPSSPLRPTPPRDPFATKPNNFGRSSHTTNTHAGKRGENKNKIEHHNARK